jgi:hypothetical protein
MMIRDGYAPDAPAVLAVRSLLASAVGGHTIEHIDRSEAAVALAVDDVILLASDGLDVLSDADIARILGERAGQGAATPAQALVAAVQALGLPRQDNATAITARVLGMDAPASPEDALPPGVIRPGPDAGPDTGSPWPLLVGFALLAAVLLSVIMTQIP